MTRSIAAAVCSGFLVTLIGCSDLTYVMNPYRYQFNPDRSPSVCLIVRDNTSVAMTYEVKKALEDKGLKVREVNKADGPECSVCVRFGCVFGGWANTTLTEATLELTRTESGKKQTIRVSSASVVPDGLATVNSQEATEKIRTLVDRLFPQPIPWVTE